MTRILHHSPRLALHNLSYHSQTLSSSPLSPTLTAATPPIPSPCSSLHIFIYFTSLFSLDYLHYLHSLPQLYFSHSKRALRASGEGKKTTKTWIYQYIICNIPSLPKFMLLQRKLLIWQPSWQTSNQDWRGASWVCQTLSPSHHPAP